MGNSESNIVNMEDNEQLKQPKLFGNLPEPYTIESIEPTLSIYHENNLILQINHQYNINTVCEIVFKYNFSMNIERRLIILTHGFRSNKNTKWLHLCKNAIFNSNSTKNQLVAILGWGNGADLSIIHYQQAASNCLAVGKWLGIFLQKFREKILKIEIYGIGHSLGAHLLGMAGRINHGLLERITGLDPAGPGFQIDNQDKRLNRNDAKMVDVIHTDGLDVPYFGTLVPLGKIDFYPNYGWNQPSTEEQSNSKPMIALDSINQNKLRKSSSTFGSYLSESHSRAIEYFIWSIKNPGKFYTHYQLERIPDVEKAVHRVHSIKYNLGIEVEMGYHLDTFISNHKKQSNHNDYIYWGNYYVHTNAQSPWC